MPWARSCRSTICARNLVAVSLSIWPRLAPIQARALRGEPSPGRVGVKSVGSNLGGPLSGLVPHRSPDVGAGLARRRPSSGAIGADELAAEIESLGRPFLIGAAFAAGKAPASFTFGVAPAASGRIDGQTARSGDSATTAIGIHTHKRVLSVVRPAFKGDRASRGYPGVMAPGPAPLFQRRAHELG